MLPSFDPQDMEASLRVIEDLTANANLIQDQLLKEILAQNARTEYLGRLLDGHLDKEAFKRLVPVVEYEDIKPYMERIANGEPSDIVSSQPITELFSSSGTSGGQPKFLPMTAEDLDRKTFFYNLIVQVMNKYGLKSLEPMDHKVSRMTARDFAMEVGDHDKMKILA